MTLCTEKGFALEVGGLGHPDTPPVILRYADGSTLNDWCKLEEEPEKSPRTVYLAPMTQKDMEGNIGLYLQVPGLAAPLLVEENIGQSPYKSGHPAFHDYIFLTFRPLTAWLYPVEINTRGRQAGHATYGPGGRAAEFELHEIEDEDRNKPTGKFLRRPRDGYFYIFKGQKLWREILYNSAEGRLIDIDLEKYRKIATPSDASPDNLWVDSSRDRREAGPCTETEIWIPAWIKRKECDYSIVYSPVQWSWAHILWRESNGGGAHGLHLSALYRGYMDGLEMDYIDKMEKLRNPVDRPMPRHRFLYQHRKTVAVQGSLDQEIIGRARTVVAKAKAASTGIFPSGSTDFEVYKNLAAEYAWEIPQCYAGADGARAAAGDILGDTARYYRGILEIPDPLLSLEMLTTRIRFYAHMLNFLTAQVNQNHPAAPILRNMLHNSRMESRGKASMYSKTIHLPPIVKLLLSNVYKAKKYGNQYEILKSMINETDVERPLKLNLRLFLRKAIYTEQKKLEFFILNNSASLDVIEHLRSIFAANGATCLSAYRLVELTLEALQYNALALDNSVTKSTWAYEDRAAARGAEAIDRIFALKPVLRQFLFPNSNLDAYSPSNSLGVNKGEKSTGDGACRLELLRKIFEAYAAQEGGGAEDIAEKPNPASAAVRVGQLCYDHYCARRTEGAEFIIPGAFNLIRMPSAYNDLLLATTKQVSDSENLLPLGATLEARETMRKTVGGAETNYAWRRLSDTARVARKKDSEVKAAPGYLFCYDYELKNSQLTPFAKSAAEVAKGLIDVKSVITSPGSRFMSVVTVWCTLYNAKESWKALDASDSQNVISFGWELLEASGTVTLFFADDLASLLRTVMSSSSKALPLRGFLAETGTVAKIAVTAEKSLTVISVINSSILALKAFSSGQMLSGLAASAALACFIRALRVVGKTKSIYGMIAMLLSFIAEFYFLEELESVLRNCPYSSGTGTLLGRYRDEQETFVELRRLTVPKPVTTVLYLSSYNDKEIQAILDDFPELKGRGPITLLFWELLPDPVVYEIITIHPRRLISWNAIPSQWGIHLHLEHSKAVIFKGDAWLRPIGESYLLDDNNKLKLNIVCQPN